MTEVERGEEAIKVYSDTISMKPDYPEAYCSQGISIARLDRHKEATEFLKEMKYLCENVEVYFCKGNALNELESYQEEALWTQKNVFLLI